MLKNWVSLKLLTIIAIKDRYTYSGLLSKEIMKIIKEYENLGINKFRVLD
jgi:hypothetical protein